GGSGAAAVSPSLGMRKRFHGDEEEAAVAAAACLLQACESLCGVVADVMSKRESLLAERLGPRLFGQLVDVIAAKARQADADAAAPTTPAAGDEIASAVAVSAGGADPVVPGASGGIALQAPPPPPWEAAAKALEWVATSTLFAPPSLQRRRSGGGLGSPVGSNGSAGFGTGGSSSRGPSMGGAAASVEEASLDAFQSLESLESLAVGGAGERSDMRWAEFAAGEKA
ncbi:unnamed protein product, partial [Phaeothamnion confervicola]